MPTYAYRCHRCGNVTEKFESIRTPANRTNKCARCGHRQRRLIGTGSGFNAGTRVEYPHYNFQLPIQPGQKLGEPNVMSRAHERDIIAGKLGERYEMNQA